MKVARLVGPGQMEIHEFSDPTPGRVKGFCLVRMMSAGICGSDLHYFRHGGLGTHKSKMPMNLGHEGSGMVVESNSTKILKGMNVAIHPGLPCGRCEFCKKGHYNLCPYDPYMGGYDNNSTLREFCVLHESQLFPLPPGVSYSRGMLLEPKGIALWSVLRSMRLIDSNLYGNVGIVGLGPIGIYVAQLCQGFGNNVFGVDILKYRENYTQEILNIGIMDGYQEYLPGCNVVFDCAGTQDAIDTVFRSTKKGGTVVLIGIPESDFITYNPHLSRIREHNILNVRRSNVSLAETYRAWEGRGEEKVRTTKFKLEDIQNAFEVASEYRDGIIKAEVVI